MYIDLCRLGQGIEADITNACISVYLSISCGYVRKELETFTNAPAHGNRIFSFRLTSEGFPSCDVQAKGETEQNNKTYLNIKATHLYLTSEHSGKEDSTGIDLYLKSKVDQ